MKNPYTRDPRAPYVLLTPADWFIVTDLGRDGLPDVQIREVIALDRDGVRQYRGYGQRVLVKGGIGERSVKFVWIDPAELPASVKAALDV